MSPLFYCYHLDLEHYRQLSSGVINPRRAATPRRTRRAGGGVLEHPRLTRLMGHVETRGKRHSKERKKSALVIFLGQVKGQVTRGHQRSNFVDFNIFLQIGT